MLDDLPGREHPPWGERPRNARRFVLGRRTSWARGRARGKSSRAGTGLGGRKWQAPGVPPLPTRWGGSRWPVRVPMKTAGRRPSELGPQARRRPAGYRRCPGAAGKLAGRMTGLSLSLAAWLPGRPP